jgi:dihydroxy-acid dehydratase
MDAAVLVGGCDKTVPAQLMAAISAGVPAVMLVTGPMLAQSFEGERLSACTDCRRYWARYRAGEVTAEKIAQLEGKLATTAGTCGVMGTASTMACLAAVLGFMPLDAASAPAVHADRLRIAEEQAPRRCG